MHEKQHDSCRTTEEAIPRMAMAEATLRTRMDQVKLIFLRKSYRRKHLDDQGTGQGASQCQVLRTLQRWLRR